MHPEKQTRKNRNPEPHSIVWLTAFLLTVLVIATVSVVGTCIYHYAQRTDCQISLYEGQQEEKTSSVKNAAAQQHTTPVISSQATHYSGSEAIEETKRSSFEVDDADQVWKTETKIELFQAEYKNADGTVTVKSADGTKVIAPGTEGSYTFSLKNTGDTSADYKIWVEAELSSNITGVPIQTRMASGSGWLLGGKTSWEQAESLNDVETSETIDAGRTAEYTIYWQWPFDQGKDETDTQMADASVSQEMTYTVTIYTLTAASTETDKSDNTQKHPLIPTLVNTGDPTKILAWAAALAASAVIIILLILKKKKNDRKREQNESEQ